MTRAVAEILVVEDNPADLELTLHALQKHILKNEIAVARNGAEALDFLFSRGAYAGRNGQPRLVLLELRLPSVDGLDVLRAVRADPALRLLPVVVLTASRQEQDVAESYKLGVNSYVVKPSNSEEFVETVQALIPYWLLLNEPPLISADG